MAGIGGTVADLLTLMGALNNELVVSSSGTDEARAILALTAAQHYFETIAASYPRVLQSTTTAVTAASTETTTYSTSLLRLDAIWLLDANSRPMYKLKKIFEVGGHVPSLPWPLQVSLAAGPGAPNGYYANMEQFYWLPLPSGVSTLRIYGLLEKTEFALRTDDFNYPKRTKLALAQFANKILQIAVGDGASDLDTLAAELFGPLMRSLKKFDRSEASPRVYNDVHST